MRKKQKKTKVIHSPLVANVIFIFFQFLRIITKRRAHKYRKKNIVFNTKIQNANFKQQYFWLIFSLSVEMFIVQPILTCNFIAASLYGHKTYTSLTFRVYFNVFRCFILSFFSCTAFVGALSNSFRLVKHKIQRKKRLKFMAFVICNNHRENFKYKNYRREKTIARTSREHLRIRQKRNKQKHVPK